MERIIEALKKDVDAGLLTAAEAGKLTNDSITALPRAKGFTITDNEINHVKFHVESYARQQENLKAAQTVLGLLAAMFPSATARLSGDGKITLCLEGEKPLDPDDTGIIRRKLEGGKI